jgi:hypothetical protein
MNMGKYKFIPFLILALIAMLGAFLNYSFSHVVGGPINTGDTAWMMTATGLVLLMTDGLSEGWLEEKILSQQCCKVLLLWV